MKPIISISCYLFMQLLTLFLVLWNCKNARVPRLPCIFRRIFPACFLLAIMLPVLGTLLPDCRVKFILQGAGNIWLGLFLFFAGPLLLLSVLACILRLILRGERRVLLHRGILLICLLTGLIVPVYGMVHAQKTKVMSYDIVTGKSAGEHKDLKVVLIADLHLSVNTHYDTIRRMVETINGMDADAVVIAGDIFNSSYRSMKDPDRYASLLRQLQAKDGVFAVCGNHDVEEGLFGGFPVTPIRDAFRTRQMDQFFEACGFRMLYDETVLLADGTVQLTGRVDGEKAGDGTAQRLAPGEVLSGIAPEKYTIVLEHEPVEFAGLKDCGADLALCGHTHAGQIFPGTLLTKLFFENSYGYRKLHGLDTVVTSGVGYYGPPMRVGCDSEISVINIHFES